MVGNFFVVQFEDIRVLVNTFQEGSHHLLINDSFIIYISQLNSEKIRIMLQNKLIQEQQNRYEPGKATIYVRNAAKRAIVLTLPKYIGLEQIKSEVYSKMRVQPQNQLLFLHGSVLPSQNNELALENKNIFHVVNLNQVNKNFIDIKVKRIQLGSQLYKFTISPATKIEDFMQDELTNYYGNVDHYFLVYTGRELKRDKSFRDEFVEDQSQLLYIHKVQNLKEVKYQRKQDIESKENKNGNNVRRNGSHSCENDTQQIHISNQQKYSVISSNNYGTENSNFRKKHRGIVQIQPKQEPQQDNNEHYYLEDSQSKNYLPFSIISSRHEEEQSSDFDKRESADSEVLNRHDHEPILVNSDHKVFQKQKSEGSAKKVKIVEQAEYCKEQSQVDEDNNAKDNHNQRSPQPNIRLTQVNVNHLQTQSDQVVKENQSLDDLLKDNEEEQKDSEQPQTPKLGVHEEISFQDTENRVKVSDNSRVSDEESKKKQSMRSENSESLLLDTSQECGFANIESNINTGKFNTISSGSKNKNETRFSSILQNNKSKQNPKLSYTFGDHSFLPLNKGSMVYMADETSYGMKNMLSSILKEYEQKYENQ